MTADPTAEAMADPQPGDHFHEIYAFRVFVIARSGDRLTYLTLNGGGTTPDDGVRFESSVGEFRRRFAYESIPGYWVMLRERGLDVSGWDEATAVAHLGGQP